MSLRICCALLISSVFLCSAAQAAKPTKTMADKRVAPKVVSVEHIFRPGQVRHPEPMVWGGRSKRGLRISTPKGEGLLHERGSAWKGLKYVSIRPSSTSQRRNYFDLKPGTYVTKKSDRGFAVMR